MIRWLTGAGVTLVLITCGTGVGAWQTVADTFTASASVQKGTASAKAAVQVTVTRYATDAERDAVTKALRDGGTPALRTALAAAADVGVLQVGDRRTSIKYASARVTSTGRLVTVVTAEPLLYLGASLPDAPAKEGFDVAIAIFEVIEGGSGMGELSPAAKVSMDEGGALTIVDYGATVVWLTNISRPK